MPRCARFNVSGAVYHLMSRFVDRQWFIENEEERARYLKLLGLAIQETDWTCLAYAVMSNHTHLAVVAGKAPLSSWIRRVHSPFADWMNLRRDRIGNLFVRGPKDLEVPPDRVGALIAYIHNNPVRAGVVRSAAESTWTSYRAYMGDTVVPRWLNVGMGMELAGYGSNFASTTQALTYVSDAELVQFRRAVRKRGGLDVATPTSSEPPTVTVVARPWSRIRIDPALVIAATAKEFGISVAELGSRRRGPLISRARRIVVLCSLALGLTGADAAVALGISQQATSRIRRQPPRETERGVIERIVTTLQVE